MGDVVAIGKRVQTGAICAKCRQSVHNARNPAAPMVWYNWTCRKHPRAAAVDPISGKAGYWGTNDLGGDYVTSDRYEYCRDYNPRGACSDYDQKLPER